MYPPPHMRWEECMYPPPHMRWEECMYPPPHMRCASTSEQQESEGQQEKSEGP
jgi:hypothetical protein